MGLLFYKPKPIARTEEPHAVIAPAVSRSAVLPNGHGELVEEAICAGAERARPPGHLARHDHRDLDQRPERTRVRALPHDLGGPDRRFRKHRGRARIEADVRHAEPRPARLGGAPALLHGDGPGVDRPLDGSHLRARIAAANSGATLTFVCGDRTVSVAITSSQTFRFASAGPTKRPWTHAAITRRAPWAFSSFAAVAIVPPVEITSSTMPTDLPRTSSAFGSIFTVYESMRFFTRKSNGTPAVRRRAPASWIASARRNSSTIIGSGWVVWTSTTCSPETGPSSRTYRSPSGNPPGCFSKATSTKPTESSCAIPRARGTDAVPPTTFIGGPGASYGM